MKNLIQDITNKAANNPDREAIIHPSDYGFDLSTEGSRECANYLESLSGVDRVKVIGKDSLLVKMR